jgi:ubiquinone/menaquinone biosynthesis C-methylase UbiE
MKHSDAQIAQEEIGRLYDSIAWFYDIWAGLTETSARKRALEIAGVRDGQSVLEVAVGTGAAFAELVRRNPNGKNTGIDLSPKMLAKAKKRLQVLPDGNYSLDISSAYALPVDDGSVDLLMNNYMFDLIPYEDMGRVLEEFSRVLKPDGRLVLVNMTLGERAGSDIYNYLYHLSPKLMGGCRGVRLAEHLGRNGFYVDSREYYQQMLFPSEVILARKTADAH